VGERDDDAVHEEVDGDSVEDAGQNGVIEQEAKATAGEKKDGGGAEGDDEVQEEAEKRGGDSACKGARTEDAAGDSLQQAQRL